MEGDTSLPERTLPEEMSAPERTLPGTAAGSSPAVVAERLSLNPKDAFHLDTKDALSVGGQPMPGPEFLLKKRKLEAALSDIDVSSADLAKMKRMCAEPFLKMVEQLAALPVFVFICNI